MNLQDYRCHETVLLVVEFSGEEGGLTHCRIKKKTRKNFQMLAKLSWR